MLAVGGLSKERASFLFPPMPYVAVYRVNGQTIEVWRIYHAAQNRP